MARTPPNITGSIIEHTNHDGRETYVWPSKAIPGEINLVIGAVALEGRIPRGEDETDLISFKPGICEVVGLQLEHWMVDFPISEPYWKPAADWQVDLLVRRVGTYTRTSGLTLIDADLYDSLQQVIRWDSSESYRGVDWELNGDSIEWLYDIEIDPETLEPSYTPRHWPPTDASWEFAYRVDETRIFTASEASGSVDLGEDSSEVLAVRVADEELILNDQVTVWAKRVRPDVLTELDDEGAYEFSGNVKRRLVEDVDFEVTPTGGFKLLVDLVVGAEVRFDYNYIVRPAQA